MTQTERIAKLMAQNAILRDEQVVKERVAAQESAELLALVGEAVEAAYQADLEVIDNV